MPCVASGQMKGATCRFIHVVVHPGGGGGWKHDGYRHVQILLCMDIPTIMKIVNNFVGRFGFFFTCWNCAYLMCDNVVEKRLQCTLVIKNTDITKFHYKEVKSLVPYVGFPLYSIVFATLIHV